MRYRLDYGTQKYGKKSQPLSRTYAWDRGDGRSGTALMATIEYHAAKANWGLERGRGVMIEGDRSSQRVGFAWCVAALVAMAIASGCLQRRHSSCQIA